MLLAAHLAAAAAVIALCAAPAQGSSQPPTLTASLLFTAGACSAFKFDGLPQKFSYSAAVNAADVGGCPPANVSISKFYVEDACVSARDNELGFQSYADVSCKKASDISFQTCEAVFNTAPSDALLKLPQVGIGKQYDGGNVCVWEKSSGHKGFIYVRNACADPVSLNVTVVQEDYAGKLCVTVAGHSLSGIAIVVIVAAALLSLVLLMSVVCCCCKLC